MRVSEKSFIEQRAVQLAILILSRREDLVITETHGVQEYGFDLLVNVCHNGQPTGRMFGVEVKARKSLQAKPLADETYKIDLAMVAFPRDLPFPLCIFMFDMENDEGYYRWLLSPQITNEGEPKVRLNQENTFRKLSRDELDGMIRLVNDWYEKRTALTFA